MDGNENRMTKEDFLGNEYSAGDVIVYAGLSGRAVQMVKAEVVELKDNGNVVVQPLAGSRWGRSRQTRYIDSRTGKGIDPYATDKHDEVSAHYRVKATGEVLSQEEYWILPWSPTKFQDHEYVPTVFKDYVQEVDSPPKKVTLTVTENIVLLEKRS